MEKAKQRLNMIPKELSKVYVLLYYSKCLIRVS